MKAFYKLILTVSGICIAFMSVAQGVATDSIVLHNYNSSHFRVPSYSYSVTEDEHGIIYVANETGVLEYDGSTWNLIKLRNFTNALAISYQPDGRIYVGGNNEFGYLERDSIGAFQYHSLREAFSDTLRIPEVWQIVKVGKDLYYHSYDRIFRFDGERAHHIPVANTWLLPFGDELFVAVYGKGIARYENDSLVYVSRSFLSEYDAPFKSLPYEGSKKVLLTEEHGLYLFDTVQYTFEKWEVGANSVFAKKGLYDGIVWDDSTYFFTSTRGGAHWVNRKGEIIRSLTRKEGVNSDDMREFHRDKRGNLWLTNDGVSHVIFPEKQDTTDIRTLIRSIYVQDTIFQVNTNEGRYETSDFGPLSSLVFNFATPGFDRADLDYAYFLEGFDQRWSPWTDNIKKEYTNLPSGEYTFHVKARLQNGQESAQATITILIPGLWYRSAAAYVVGVFLILLIVWAAASYHAAKLKQKNTHLERIVHERTRELVAQKEELVVANTELDNFVYRSSHDLIAPLKSLKGLIDITRKETSPEYRVEYFDMMERSVVKLEEFIQSILQYSSNAKAEAIRESIDFNAIIDSIIEDLKYFDKADRVTLHRDIADNVEFYSDQKRLKIVMSNLIANAVKYHNYRQPSPHIYVRLYNKDGHAIIEVEDNGQGIEPKYLDTIFDMFVRASDNSEGSGLGLYIVKDTVQKLGGTIEVESEFDRGTKFIMTFS